MAVGRGGGGEGGTWWIQPPRSSALEMVADMASIWMCFGQLIMVSSQTLPRPGSPI